MLVRCQLTSAAVHHGIIARPTDTGLDGQAQQHRKHYAVVEKLASVVGMIMYTIVRYLNRHGYNDFPCTMASECCST